MLSTPPNSPPVVRCGSFAQVAYWEPAKWVSKLRSLKTDQNQVLLKMDLDAGHFSASDRYKYIREKAYDQAIVLDKLGLAPGPVHTHPGPAPAE